MLQKIKIGTRLALAFAVLLLLISALAAGGISGAKRLTERSAALYGDRTVPLGVLAEISHLTQRNRVLVMDMLMDPGTSNLQASHAALTANVERIHALWTAYSGKALGAEEHGLAQAFADANATYLDKGLIPAASALVAGKYDDGSELYINQIRPNAAKVQDAEQVTQLRAQIETARQASQSATTTPLPQEPLPPSPASAGPAVPAPGPAMLPSGAPRSVALLLPLTGRYRSAGTAVRDGFVAACLTDAAER